MAGTGAAVGQDYIFILGGADGSLFFKGAILKDAHPGFPKRAWMYNTITNTWNSAGSIPVNQVTTVPVKWGGEYYYCWGRDKAPRSYTKGLEGHSLSLLSGKWILIYLPDRGFF